MLIDVRDHSIYLKDPLGRLSPIDKSQLSFWNFQFDFISNEHSSTLDRQLLVKLVRYLDKEALDYELTPQALKLKNEIEHEENSFQNFKAAVANYKNGIYDIDHFNAFRSFVLENVKRSLKTHQLKAAYHLYITGNGANFSVPGSGKTAVVLSVYEKLRLEGKVNVLFVVGPASCFGPWKNEFYETLHRNSNAIILAGGNKRIRTNHYKNFSTLNSELLLTSFQSLLSDESDVRYFLEQQKVKAFLIIDEAHYIKQINGNWARAILNQSQLAAKRCVLTGTPMPKSYSDLFNLFDFLWPKNHPISSNNKAIIKHSEQKGNIHSIKAILDDSVGPLFYRVRKSDLQLTEQKFLDPELVKMNRLERKIYDAVYSRIKHFSKKEYFKNIDFISKVGRGRIIRLRQAVSYAKLLNTAIDDYREKIFEDDNDLKNIVRHYDELEVPSKITVLIRKVKKLRKANQKIVIWSNFIESLRLIEKHLRLNGFNCKKIYGDTPIEGATISNEETREKIRDEFVNPQSGLDILIANPAACAESISLHKTCHNSIYYDLSYNCAQYLQSLDRIHRVGGSEYISATYHFLQYADTIDQDIKENIDRKRIKMFAIVEQDYPIYSLNMFEDDDDLEAYKRLFGKKKSKNS